MSSIIVGLDIGTCFIRTVIAEVTPEGGLEVIGTAKKASSGLRNGVIVNIDAAMASIREVVEEAEQKAGMEVTSVFTAIGGAQVESLNSKGQIGVDPSGKNRSLEISDNAKKRAIEAAKAVVIPLDKKLIHVIPQEYIIDNLTGYKNPLGMMGVRLEVQVHLVTASITAYTNIQQCITRAGYMLDGVMLKTLAATYATIHEDEMDLGSILIDLGGGTTDVMVLYKGAPVYTTSIPVGGNHVTNDIAIVKGIPSAAAEKIKIEKGCCWVTGNEMEEEVIIPSVGGRPPEQSTRYELCQIIQPRVEEIFSMVRHQVVRNSKLTKLSGSIVLTGGGALMPGVVELAQSVWGTTSVRVGVSGKMGGGDDSYRDADYATAMGLILAHKDMGSSEKQHKMQKKSDSGKKKGFSMKEILGKFF